MLMMQLDARMMRVVCFFCYVLNITLIISFMDFIKIH